MYYYEYPTYPEAFRDWRCHPSIGPLESYINARRAPWQRISRVNPRLSHRGVLPPYHSPPGPSLAKFSPHGSNASDAALDGLSYLRRCNSETDWFHIPSPLSPPRAMVPLSETACVFTPPSATYLRPPAHLTAATPWSSLSACDLPCPAGPCLVPCCVPGPGCLVALCLFWWVGAKRGVGLGVVHFVLSRPCCFVHFEYTLNASYQPPP